MSILIATIGFLVSLCSIFYWKASGAFINWFWQDAREEAEMVLEDKRSSSKLPVKFCLKSTVLVLLLFSATTGLILFNESSQNIILVKLLICSYLIFLALVDFRSMMLPDILNYIGIWSFLVIASLDLSPFGLELKTCVLGAFGCYMVCWLIIQFGYKVLKAAIMGHGDAKALAMVGALFGFKISYLIFFSSALVTSIFSLAQFAFLKPGTYNKTLPFAPFLSFTTILMVIFYNDITLYLASSYPSLF